MPDDKPSQFDAIIDALKNSRMSLSPPAEPLGRQSFPGQGFPGVPTLGELEADLRADAGRPQLPADPFSDTDSASIALADMYHSMIRSGIPERSTEVILGQMLGAMFSGDKPQQ